MKKIKKVILLVSCLILVPTSIVFADVNAMEKSAMSVSDGEETISSFTITGYEFTYENAPEFAKNEYEKSCKELNIVPDKNHKIFIPDNAINMYNLDEYSGATREAFFVEFKKTYFLVTGSRSYRVDIAASSSIVGYNHTTSGNPVHLAQILCNQINGAGIKADGQFGTNTYNAVKSLQGRLGVTKDGIVGKSTWEAAGYAL
ncbi:peptidoglycan-binding domain-containing protein [Clostridioides difficile]